MMLSDRKTVPESFSEPPEAAAWAARGHEYQLEGKLSQAEDAYLRALRLCDRLLETTGERHYGLAAAEYCACLADLSMEQGNMHGGDYYYAQILRYRQE